MRYETQFVDLQVQHVAAVRAYVKQDDLKEFLAGAFAEVIGVLDRQGLGPTGAPFGRYLVLDDGAFEAEVGFPCSDVVQPEGRVEPRELPAGRVARTVHVGPYDAVGSAYEAATDWLTDEGYVTVGTPWECYLDGPEVANPRTEVFVPCEHAHPVHRQPAHA